MTAKTATKPNRGFSAAISRVEPALAAWRQRRKHREAIPDALWQALVPLARVHGVSPVAQALRLNYTALKRHLVAEPAPPAGGTATDPARFVEVQVAPWASGPPRVIELEDRLGAKLTLRLAPEDRPQFLALAQGLWRQRA